MDESQRMNREVIKITVISMYLYTEKIASINIISSLMIIIPLSSLTYSKIENFQCFQRVHCYKNYNNFNIILIIFTALISAVNQTSLKTKKTKILLRLFTCSISQIKS